MILRFIYQVPYGQNDPLFGKDIGFYLFSLPVYVALKNWMVLILLLSGAMAGAVYVLHGEINLDSRLWRFSPAALAHGSALLGVYFAVKAWSYALDRYLLLYDDNGVVVGAGYTDVHVELPVLWLLIGLAAAAAIVAWANVRLRTYRLLIGRCRGGLRQCVPARRTASRAVPTLLCEAKRAAVGDTVSQAEHRPDAGSLQSAADHREAVSRGAGAHLPVAAGQPRNHRQHPAVGLAAADGHLCAASGDPHLLPVPRRRHRSLPDRWHLSAGDARRRASSSPRCCQPTRRPGSTSICCSPTATASSCRR